MTARETLESRVSALNTILATVAQEGRDSALNDVTAAAKTAKDEASANAIAELCKLQPAELVSAYCECQEYAYPAPYKTDTGRYEVKDYTAVLPFVAIEEAYFKANGVRLTAKGDYNKYVAVLLYCCQRHAIAKSNSAEYSVAHLADGNKSKFEELAATDKRWKGTGMSDLEFQFGEVLAAVLPSGVAPIAPVRNSDRRYFLKMMTKPDGKGSFVVPRADTVYKYLFLAMQWAHDKRVYDVKSSFAGFVSGVDANAGKGKDKDAGKENPPAEEKSNNTGDTATERKAPNENSAMAEAARKNAKPVEEESTVVADNSKEIERAMESCGFTKPAETAAEQADNGESK